MSGGESEGDRALGGERLQSNTKLGMQGAEEVVRLAIWAAVVSRGRAVGASSECYSHRLDEPLKLPSRSIVA